jgi:tetratricopeptide (TPR) repeat protein
VNPVNLFKRESKPEHIATPLPSGSKPAPAAVKPTTTQAQTPSPVTNKPAPTAVAPPPKPLARYTYRVLASPAPGDRQAAEQHFTRGVAAYRDGKWADAIAAYEAATQADAAYFDAYYNLGLATSQAARLADSLGAYETALKLMPDSADARYNFALGLKQGGYFLDAAEELERLIAGRADDARAHLALANLYAQQLRQPAKAREHYNRVLNLDPRHPQADLIRRWLVRNPG